jgi:hypothetical protein
MSDISPKSLEMSTAVSREAQCHLRALVDGYGASVPLKAILPSIARKIGIGHRRARAIWHGEARRIEGHELDALRAAAKPKDQNTHAVRLFAAATALEAIDADFHRSEIDRLRNLARALGRADVGGDA